jgi:predicted transcriptional regulator
MLKQTAFRLPPATVDKLDEIARRMPKRPGGMPCTRTDAVIVAVDKMHETTSNAAERREGE